MVQVKKIIFILIAFIIAVAATARASESPLSGFHEEQVSSIEDVVSEAINKGKIPGAVIIVSNSDRVVYRRAFGYRSIAPERLPMTVDTIFDIASLTKVVATTTAVMQLAEKGKLNIDAPVCKYWPAFKTNGKKQITLRELLTHYSGLKADLKLKRKWSGYKKAVKMILREKPEAPPGSHFTYSDINFEVLGELVRRVSGKPLDIYCKLNIFKPLGMDDTGFVPSSELRDRIAPTERLGSGRMLLGEVHDPSAYRMGGVAGHAGLFSTADDLSVFARMLLNNGDFNNKRILSPASIRKMTMPQSPPGKKILRGFGWDIEAPFAANREELPPVGLYGHLGYTGTAIWIDPITKTYVIVLTNRVHPDGKGDVKELRAQIKAIVSKAIGPVSPDQVLSNRPPLSNYYKRIESSPLRGRGNGRVLTGIDVLHAEGFSSLNGLRIGLITNHTGLDASGRSTLGLLYKAQGVKLAAIFSPEHGLYGKADKKIASTEDAVTRLPVYSLYGEVRRPTGKMLDGLDALVFDMQDAGVRFYTYISTMAYAMEAAAKKGIPFFVLDRPNPINASFVQGPVMDKELKSFTGYFTLPVRHGMTVGELAKMFNAENNIGAELHVIRMQGYQRNIWFDEAGLRWVNPSPNLRSLTQAILYPGVAMVEGANVSVGRGTDSPFELFGAPWVDAEELAGYLGTRGINGVKFLPVDFTPKADIYKNKICHGVRIILNDRQSLDAAVLGIEIVSALHKLYAKNFQVDKTIGLIGARSVLQAIKEGKDPGSIVMLYQEPLEQFLKLREKYLLY